MDDIYKPEAYSLTKKVDFDCDFTSLLSGVTVDMQGRLAVSLEEVAIICGCYPFSSNPHSPFIIEPYLHQAEEMIKGGTEFKGLLEQSVKLIQILCMKFREYQDNPKESTITLNVSPVFVVAASILGYPHAQETYNEMYGIPDGCDEHPMAMIELDCDIAAAYWGTASVFPPCEMDDYFYGMIEEMQDFIRESFENG